MFNVDGVNYPGKKNSVYLTDGDLSQSLEYIYKKTSAELIQFNDKKFIHKVGEMCDGRYAREA